MSAISIALAFHMSMSLWSVPSHFVLNCLNTFFAVLYSVCSKLRWLVYKIYLMCFEMGDVHIFCPPAGSTWSCGVKGVPMDCALQMSCLIRRCLLRSTRTIATVCVPTVACKVCICRLWVQLSDIAIEKECALFEAQG